ncbi:MAG: hypothetical protein IPL11_01120 [Candidatus Accumulibacter sp.]|nr:hypothetical protein [Accumulibacter sp.]
MSCTYSDECHSGLCRNLASRCRHVEQRKNLEIINRSGEHLLALINDVLDMAKIDAGRMVVENTTFNLSEMVHEVADLLHLRAEARNLELVWIGLPDLPRFVHADVAAAPGDHQPGRRAIRNYRAGWRHLAPARCLAIPPVACG